MALFTQPYLQAIGVAVSRRQLDRYIVLLDFTRCVSPAKTQISRFLSRCVDG